MDRHRVISDSESEESLDELQKIVELVPFRRRLMRRDWFAELGECEFRARFRLRKTVVVQLGERLYPLLCPKGEGGHSISTLDQLLIALRYFQ